MVSKKTIKNLLIKIIPRRLVFPLAVLGLYIVLLCVVPEKAIAAMKNSMIFFSHILGPLCLVFFLKIVLNLILKPANVVKILGKEISVRLEILAAVAGIFSAGPIYVWYPVLKDLREKGAKHSLFAVFLVNRAVKPFLLPVMISIFGWVYVAFLTIFIVAGSLFVGFVVGAFLDSPTALLRRKED